MFGVQIIIINFIIVRSYPRGYNKTVYLHAAYIKRNENKTLFVRHHFAPRIIFIM